MKASDTPIVFARTNLIVGAYATAPSLFNWDVRSEDEYFGRIFSLQNVGGLEVPYWGDSFCRYDESIFLSQIPSAWSNVVTVIPGIMSRVSENSTFGLASKFEHGQRCAVEMMERVRKKITETIRDYPNFQCNTVVFCSAPITEMGPAPRARFKDSLKEIVSWDWGELQLAVEHCDKYQEDGSHQKGGMSLEDELAVLEEIQQESYMKTRLGITINWGRSAIEGRDAKTPVEHINMAKKMGLLRGLMFSGTSAEECPYGAWLDTHAPPREVIADDSYNESLLLDHWSRINCISEVGDSSIDYMGIKIGAQPDNISISERYRLNNHSLSWIKGA